jgi:hypothetical protein
MLALGRKTPNRERGVEMLSERRWRTRGRRVGHPLMIVHDDTMVVAVVFLGGGVSESRRREGIL